ncbi:MAG: head-tail connector protein [Leuconostoc mesenteroides]
MNEETIASIMKYVKQSLRLSFDDDDEDAYIKMIVKSSGDHVVGAVGGEATDDFYNENNNEFILATSLLAHSHYLNRGANSDVNLEETSFGYQQYVLSLKASYLVWRSKNG